MIKTGLQSVYRLIDPVTQETRYVGMSSNPQKRYDQHVAGLSKYNAEWIQALQKDQLLPVLGVLEADLYPSLANDREKYWIQYFLDQGAILTNQRICAPINQSVQSLSLPLEKDSTYTLEQLICNLPVRLVDLSRESGVHEETIKRIRKGRATRLSIAKSMISALSKIYQCPLSLDNVTGITIYQKDSNQAGPRGGSMERKESYSIIELFDFLPITIAKLARQSKINEVTLARIRDGKQTRRDTVNKLMMALSEVYGMTLTIKNVNGIHVMHNRRLEGKEEGLDDAA